MHDVFAYFYYINKYTRYVFFLKLSENSKLSIYQFIKKKLDSICKNVREYL